MTFSKEMMEALELDRQKLESMGAPQPTANEVFHCSKCGCRGEEKFSWDGNCLVCEEGENDADFDSLKFAEGMENEKHVWGQRDEDGELK